MIRFGLAFVGLAVLSCVPLFFVESETAIVACSWLALTFGGLGAFFLIGRLLEKVAPANPVDEFERNAFRPRHDPTVPKKPLRTAPAATPTVRKAA